MTSTQDEQHGRRRLEAIRDGATFSQVYGLEWCFDMAVQIRADLTHALASLPAPDTTGEVAAYLYTRGSTNHEVPYLTLERDKLFAELEDTRETPLYAAPQPTATGGAFKSGDRVTKIKGSKWTGRVVGFYSTSLTPVGYAVESETETGSVQIYPEAALRALNPADAEGGRE